MSDQLEVARAAFAAGDEEVRRAAVAQLAVEPDAAEAGAALAFFVEAMGDDSWRVRKEAAGRAATWPERGRAAEAMVAALAEPENVGRRNAAVEALVRMGSFALPPLVDALGRRPEHRKLIVDALGLIGDRRAAVPLGESLDDADENVRAAAAESLGRVGGPEAAEALTRALGRGELLLSVAALDGLNRLGATLPVAVAAPLTETPVTRAGALEALGSAGDAEALPYLLNGLTDAGRSAREAAATGIVRLHRALDEPGRRRVEGALRALPEEAERRLTAALLEAGAAVRRAAATLLGWARRAQAVRPLALALGDADVHEAASEAIAQIGAGAVAQLCALAPELDAGLRAAIYAQFPRLGPAAADPRVQQLLAQALDEDDAEAAAAAARALGEVGGKDALGRLAGALGRSPRLALAATQALSRLGARYYDEVRMLVHARGLAGSDAPHLCRVLGAMGRAEDAPLLLGALKADPPALRRAAAEALAGLVGASGAAGEEVEDALCYALADESSEVRERAARALGALSSARAVAALTGACADAEPAVRAAAARALGQMPLGAQAAQAARAALRTLARSSDGVTALHAVEALGRAGDDADEGLLLEAIDREDAEVAKAAARALGQIGGASGGARAVEALGRALAHPRWDVRRAAAQALGDRGGAPAQALLRARDAVEDDGLVREAIAEAQARASVERR